MAAPKQTSSIIQRLSSLSEKALESDPEVKKEAWLLSKQLTVSLEDPVNIATELVFSPLIATAARIAVDLDLFSRIEKHEGPIKTAQLASASGGEEVMITRLLRLLAAIGFVQEAENNLWAATPITKAMALPTITSGYRVVWDLLITSAVKAPKFLREAGHRSPTEPNNGFIQYAYQSKHSTFDLLASIPSLLQDFNNFMGNAMGARGYWVDWFPVEERLLMDLDSSSALLVDVGGGKGHDMQAFHTKYPRRGRIVLQDLPQGLAGVREGDLDPAIERMVQDFFTEQQVQGARAYFLHHILHDWADSYCLKILECLRGAMRPGYSKLLVHELVLPDCGASAYQSIYDMAMMTFNGGMERSRTQWARLLDEAGFEVIGFWVNDEDADGIVEAMLKI